MDDGDVGARGGSGLSSSVAGKGESSKGKHFGRFQKLIMLDTVRKSVDGV